MGTVAADYIPVNLNIKKINYIMHHTINSSNLLPSQVQRFLFTSSSQNDI